MIKTSVSAFAIRSLLIFFVLMETCYGATTPAPGVLSRNITISWNGTTRYYDLYIPVHLSKTPALWVMLHPTMNFAAIPHPFDPEPMMELANENGFIVLWPISSYNSEMWYWDAYFLDYSFSDDPDDSGYIRSLILTFESEYPISDVFVSGMSSGAFMAHRVAIDSADLVSAVGAASGQVYAENSVNTLPLPLQPVSVLMLNGDEDEEVGYCGSKHEWGNSASPASDVSLDYWADVAGYTGTLPTLCTDGQPTSGVDGALIQSDGVTVQFIREIGVGHEWVPGTEMVMWEFFQQNARSPLSSHR
jgi:poly(3-hydroxybutyrate) depolymerase